MLDSKLNIYVLDRDMKPFKEVAFGNYDDFFCLYLIVDDSQQKYLIHHKKQ